MKSNVNKSAISFKLAERPTLFLWQHSAPNALHLHNTSICGLEKWRNGQWNSQVEGSDGPKIHSTTHLKSSLEVTSPLASIHHGEINVQLGADWTQAHQARGYMWTHQQCHPFLYSTHVTKQLHGSSSPQFSSSLPGGSAYGPGVWKNLEPSQGKTQRENDEKQQNLSRCHPRWVAVLCQKCLGEMSRILTFEVPLPMKWIQVKQHQMPWITMLGRCCFTNAYNCVVMVVYRALLGWLWREELSPAHNTARESPPVDSKRVEEYRNMTNDKNFSDQKPFTITQSKDS